MTHTTTRRRLAVEPLEARDCPALTILFDYRFDAGGFFNDPARRAVLRQAADDLGARLDAPLAPLVPGGANSFTATFFNPADGRQAAVPNLALPANTVVVYAGGRPVGGAEAGFGGFGGYQAGGSREWLDALASRGPGFTLWGGSLTLDTGTNWYAGGSAAGLRPGQVDLYSVAVHELGHVLGLGTAPGWKAYSANGSFAGPAAAAVYGRPVPLGPDGAHWDDRVNASLDPHLPTGVRVAFTALDYAALRDIGWRVSGVPGVPDGYGPGPSPPPVVPVPLGSPLLGSAPRAGTRLAVLTGPRDGSAQVFTAGGGKLAAAGDRFVPFPGYTGVVRSVVADFDGDGTADFAFTTGAGPAARVRVVSGASGGDLAGPTTVLDGFTGGAYLAAGDVDRDGKAELAVSADAGGGNRVSIFKLAPAGLVLAADVMAFGDPVFRGGSRVAMADVNRDGAADLVVGAGTGGGPRVAVYTGAGLAAGRADRLVPDFFALDSRLRSGVFVTAADFDADGYADLAYSTGTSGGPRVRVVGGKQLVQNPGADVAALPAMADFFALDPNDRNGIRILARDLDADGRAELLVAGGGKQNGITRVIPAAQFGAPATPLQSPFADPVTLDGIYVG
ncbi:MAG: FG-GAP-like repeat-containing protein [Gemmataceae bacterium]|nr:FG-GAP-like repeat-containing protein [Gemmataceae bacterium]